MKYDDIFYDLFNVGLFVMTFNATSYFILVLCSYLKTYFKIQFAILEVYF